MVVTNQTASTAKSTPTHPFPRICGPIMCSWLPNTHRRELSPKQTRRENLWLHGLTSIHQRLHWLYTRLEMMALKEITSLSFIVLGWPLQLMSSWATELRDRQFHTERRELSKVLPYELLSYEFRVLSYELWATFLLSYELTELMSYELPSYLVFLVISS